MNLLAAAAAEGSAVRKIVLKTSTLIYGSNFADPYFFRESTRHAALEEGVAGYVRTLPDGSVEAAFEGPPDAVERLVAFARSGPPDAEVRENGSSQMAKARSVILTSHAS